VSHRFSGRVGALLLGSLAAITACGSRDNLFVQDDEIGVGEQAGTLSFGAGGNASVGGRAGGVSFGGASVGGRAGGASVGGRAGGVGVGGSIVSVAGSLGFGGRVGVAGSPAGGFHAGGAAGASFGGSFSSGGAVAFGGSAGFGAVGNIGNEAGAGGAADWCEACMALNTGANPCAAFACDLQHLSCDLVLQNEGQPCADSGTNFCVQSVCKAGQCITEFANTCAQTQCMSGICDPSSGLCSQIPVIGPCDDGDPCTVNDQCLNGMCAAGKPVGCQNNDKCCPTGCTSSQDNDCASSTQIVLSSTDRGWYENNGFHNAINKNTFTGSTMGNIYNSYFNFDLSQVKGTITSALILLHEETYYGTDASETVSVWDVTAAPDSVSTSAQSVAIYQDLQSGNEYGSFTVVPALTGSSLTVGLSAKAVADLNAARGAAFTLGLHIDTLSGKMGDEGVRFSTADEPQPNQLILNF
jgi:hypothetical protein